MSDTRWTKEQQLAIDESGRNLLVAAAAGAGKTAVLVERIIKKIIDDRSNIDIDSLLVVTFTNAAAAEMRERIGEAIAAQLDKNPENVRLQRQMTLLGKASITTMHSFCLDVIRNNFHRLDIDPDFRIGDETECTLLKQDIIDQLFEDIYEEDNLPEGFVQLLDSYGGNRSDTSIQDMVLKLYSFVQSCPWPEKWLYEKLELCRAGSCEDFAGTLSGKMLINMASIELQGIQEMVEEAKKTAQNSDGLSKYLDTVISDECCVAKLPDILKGSWDSIVKNFSSIELDKLGRCGKDADKDAQERVKKLRDSYKKALKDLKEQYFCLNTDEILKEIEHLYPALEALVKITVDFTHRYSAEKASKSILDFNDLEHLCLKILITEEPDGTMRPSETARALKEKYSEILVDEYQDSNEVQEVIINAVSRADISHPDVFMVGDVKQSIYRFRQARPDLFMSKYNSYPSNHDGDSMKIQLFKNFRSRENVVHSVNFIFKQIMSKNVGELDYTDEEALNPGAEFAENDDPSFITGGATEIYVIDTSDSTKGENESDTPAFSDSDEESGEEAEQGSTAAEPEELDNIQAEAQLVADRIKKLMDKDSQGKSFAVFDKSIGKYRPVEFKDIVILLRTTKNWAETFVDTLAVNGIPSFADTGSGYFKTVEIQIVLSLLQIVDNPLQDIPLLSVLRSPIGGFDVEELGKLRLIQRDGPFFHALKKAEESSSELGIKARDFCRKLDRWREKAIYTPVDELIWQLYTETGYYSFAGTMVGGKQRQANLRLLFERARQFEKSSYRGLFNFISFIGKMKETSGDMGTAKTLSENENLVRIMSIHKSKGLEFPVCFVSGCGKKFNMLDLNDKVLLHHDVGFGPEFIDIERRISYPTVQKLAVKAKIKLETVSEEMRILYVAFTRAREKLIITGSVRGFGKSVVKWSGSALKKGYKLPEYAMLSASNYLDWIMPSVMRHGSISGLREYAVEKGFFTGELIQDKSDWQFCRMNKSELTGSITQTDETKKADLSELIHDRNEDLYKEINRRLGFTYGYKKVEGLESKFTVTELKRRYQEIDGKSLVEKSSVQMVKKPAFLEEKRGFSAAERGTIQHFVMQHLDIEIEPEESVIRAKIVEMADRVLLTHEQAEVVNTGTIKTFLKSELCDRMKKAVLLKREVPFNLQIQPEEVGYDSSLDEMILLQGIIDLYFVEDDGKAVIVDYKTDRVIKDAATLARERYYMQLEMYKRALESIENIEVKEVYVYFFETGEAIAL